MSTATNIENGDSGFSSVNPSTLTQEASQSQVSSQIATPGILSLLVEAQTNLGELQQVIALANTEVLESPDGIKKYIRFSELVGESTEHALEKVYNDLVDALAKQEQAEQKRHKFKLVSIICEAIATAVLAVGAVATGGATAALIPLVFTALTMIPVGDSNVMALASQKLGGAIHSQLAATLLLGAAAIVLSGGIGGLGVGVACGAQTLLTTGLPTELAELSPNQTAQLVISIIVSVILIAASIAAIGLQSAKSAAGNAAAAAEDATETTLGKLVKVIKDLIAKLSPEETSTLGRALNSIKAGLTKAAEVLTNNKNAVFAIQGFNQITAALFDVAAAKVLLDEADPVHDANEDTALVTKYQSELSMNTSNGQALQDNINSLISGITEEQIATSKYAFAGLQRTAEVMA